MTQYMDHVNPVVRSPPFPDVIMWAVDMMQQLPAVIEMHYDTFLNHCM